MVACKRKPGRRPSPLPGNSLRHPLCISGNANGNTSAGYGRGRALPLDCIQKPIPERSRSGGPVIGVSPQNPFSSLLLAAAGGEREKKEVPGDTPDPGRENPAPLQDIHQFREHYPNGKLQVRYLYKNSITTNATESANQKGYRNQCKSLICRRYARIASIANQLISYLILWITNMSL